MLHSGALWHNVPACMTQEVELFLRHPIGLPVSDIFLTVWVMQRNMASFTKQGAGLLVPLAGATWGCILQERHMQAAMGCLLSSLSAQIARRSRTEWLLRACCTQSVFCSPFDSEEMWLQKFCKE